MKITHSKYFIILLTQVFLFWDMASVAGQETSASNFHSQINEPWDSYMNQRDIHQDFQANYALDWGMINQTSPEKVQIVKLVGNEEFSKFIALADELANIEALSVVNASIYSSKFEELIQKLSTKQHFRKLDLTNCSISAIPTSISKLKSLETLHLARNRISTLPNELCSLENLSYLRLYNNRTLVSLPENLGNLVNLELLDIAGTKVQQFPASIGKCNNLKHITANACNIQSIPTEIAGCRSLSYVNLGANKIDIIPKEIASCTNLKNLNLSSNNIQVIPLELCSMIWLESLDLGENQIEEIPSQLKKLTNLYTCALNGNKLTIFPKEVFAFKNLINLWLHNNEIERIPIEVADFKRLMGFIVDADTEQLKNDIEAIKKVNPRIRIMTHYTNKK